MILCEVMDEISMGAYKLNLVFTPLVLSSPCSEYVQLYCACRMSEVS